MLDGTMVLTSPTGDEYRTEPTGAALFPALRTPAGAPSGDLVAATDTGPPAGNRSLAMPTRERTRDQDRRARIDRERGLRAQINAERARAHAAHLAEVEANDPPPY